MLSASSQTLKRALHDLLLDVSSTESQLDANKGNAIFGLTTLSNFLLSGDLKTDLCLGRQEHCDKNELKRAIVAKVRLTWEAVARTNMKVMMRRMRLDF